MKILVIGTGSSQFVKETIEHVLLTDETNEVFVTYNKSNSELFLGFYEENKVNIIDTHCKKNIFSRIPKLGVLYNLYHAVKGEAEKGKFDVIHVHSMNNYVWTSFVIKHLRKYAKRIVCTYYGSDILKQSKKNLVKFEKLFGNIDAFTMASDSLIDKFHEEYGHKYDDKINKVKFGLSNLCDIDRCDASIAKENLKIDKNKLAVSIGHNYCVEQQHLLVLDELKRLKKSTIRNLTIILQLTYGNGTIEYIDEVVSKANEIGCDVLVLRDYMHGEEIANLVSATDVFINSQKTDAMSGAMMEYIYAGSIVLNPKWLNYNEVANRGIEFVTYDTFADIPDIIDKIMSGEKLIGTAGNHDIVKGVNHWDMQCESWKQVLLCEI